MRRRAGREGREEIGCIRRQTGVGKKDQVQWGDSKEDRGEGRERRRWGGRVHSSEGG